MNGILEVYSRCKDRGNHPVLQRGFSKPSRRGCCRVVDQPTTYIQRLKYWTTVEGFAMRFCTDTRGAQKITTTDDTRQPVDGICVIPSRNAGTVCRNCLWPLKDIFGAFSSLR